MCMPTENTLINYIFLLLKDIPGGGTCTSEGEAQTEGGPVQENGGGGQ